MFRKRVCTLGLMATFATPLIADWKITTVVHSGSNQSVETEYFNGGLKRVDQADPHTKYSVVYDFDRRRQTVWKTDPKEYAVLGMEQREMPAATGPEIVIDRVTVDTGERKTFFGREARHLVTDETRTGPNASKTKIDGWYVDVPSLPRGLQSAGVYVLASVNGRLRISINQTGPAPSGLTVWSKRATKNMNPNGSPDEHEMTSEITELVEGPLSSEVFAPPAGFKRVISFTGETPPSWTDQLKLEWERLGDWIFGVFE